MELELLSAVASQPFEACEAEWKKVLGSLRLGILYVPAIQSVLKEGRWMSAPNPIAYVRKSAVRTAVRMGIVYIRPNQTREVLACDLRFADEDGRELDHDEKLGTALYDYEDKYGRDYGFEHAAEGQLPEGIFNDELDIDWERAGELAGLDGGERLVLELQWIGFSRYAALRACLTDEDRRYLEAAWKRFERDRERLSEVLKSGKKGRGKRRHAEVPERELILMETGEGELKISFRRSVPKEGF
jgi:hypothetical protein